MFKRLQDWLALTATERRVLLFVTGAFVAGLGIRLYQETFPATPWFDYSASDSTFAALSSAAIRDDKEPEVELFGPLNLNTATKPQLVALPGIGEVMAERILRHREDHGPFKDIEALRSVKGISGRSLEKIKHLVTVD
ncbi:MAG: helix-hairpin-helix domain-containing protein [Bacteroidota bacterium]